MKLNLARLNFCRSDGTSTNTGRYGSIRAEVSKLHQRVKEGSNKIFSTNMDYKYYLRLFAVLLVIFGSGFLVIKLRNSQECLCRNKRELKMVNIFSRHGDRAPGDNFTLVDQHRTVLRSFWPNGFGNLTELGIYREYRIGLALRQIYNKYLGYDSSKVLAFSSPSPRCVHTMNIILKGLYEIQISEALGRREASWRNCTKCFPRGSGFPEEYRNIKIDTESVPALTFEFLNNCSYRKSHPSKLDEDLLLDPEISSLVGIDLLNDVLWKRYKRTLNFTALGLWSNIHTEIIMDRTQWTIHYADHYSDWINIKLASKDNSSMTLLDLLEEIVTIAYPARIKGVSTLIQLSPIINSFVESQKMALGYNATSKRMEMYRDKKMVIYTSHDSILMIMLYNLGIIRRDSSYMTRFFKFANSEDSLEKFLAGLKMPQFGSSVRFELWQVELDNESDKFPVVEVSIYNEEDPKFGAIEYKTIEFGSFCRRSFLTRYPGNTEGLSHFYDSRFKINERNSCPFELWLNLTSNLILDDEQMKELCEQS